MRRALPSFASALAFAMIAGCASGEQSAATVGTSVDGGSEEIAGPLQGTLYAPARRFVRSYCAGCHWKDGKDPKQKVAYPAFHVDIRRLGRA
jgi:hypothetical protein